MYYCYHGGILGFYKFYSIIPPSTLIQIWKLLSLGRPNPTTAGVNMQVTACFLRDPHQTICLDLPVVYEGPAVAVLLCLSSYDLSMPSKSNEPFHCNRWTEFMGDDSGENCVDLKRRVSYFKLFRWEKRTPIWDSRGVERTMARWICGVSLRVEDL